MSDWNKKVIAEFRANAGKVGGPHEGWEMLLLHTTGAKSGLQRINPLVAMANGSEYVVIASNGGASKHPAWYHNLIANPQVTVEYGTEKFEATANIAEEPNRSQLYAKIAERHSFFNEYAKKAGRTIPVVILKREA